MKKLLKEFREFIARGNVFDMAVGVVIGGAFGKITSSLVADLIMPALALICGSEDMTALNITVRPAQLAEDGTVVKAAISLGFGTFVSTVLDFLLIAAVIFLLIKAINTMKARFEKKKEEEEAEKEPEPTKEELLLTEIRDLLKENKE